MAQRDGGHVSRWADVGYRAGWRLTRVLPSPVVERVFRAAADVVARRNGPAVRQLRRNLARVVPAAGVVELDELVRRGLRSYARYWREVFRLPTVDHRALRREVDPHVDGRRYLDEALAAGRGAVVALPHTGNWDVAGVWLVGHSGRFTTVAERLRPESLYRRFVAYREWLGFEILPSTGGDMRAHDVLEQRLCDNRVVCLLADRDLTSSGVAVELFGEPTSMPSGPARLALATGAPLLPAGAYFAPDGWRVRIHPPVACVPVSGDASYDSYCHAQVAAATQAMADVFAADIAERPEDWHMLQPLWPADLPEHRRAAVPRCTG
ncbi:MAG: phosphatidylinositol mannoside acyltransferase [Pseudonocardiaceae bacterium]|nr:phosphatidylinositol mannoside acyltransferase [Pseudonocardiaceae bacterium]